MEGAGTHLNQSGHAAVERRALTRVTNTTAVSTQRAIAELSGVECRTVGTAQSIGTSMQRR